MAKHEAGESQPRRRGKADRAEAPTPEEQASHFNLDYWPEVPQESRPRKVIFDTLRQVDAEALQSRGYDVVLLRLMPRRSDVEDQQYLITLMQGVSDGTVALDKGRSEALSAELRARQLGGKKELKRRDGAAKTDDVRQILAWQDSRHRFTENTTMLDPADVQRFLRRVAEENARADAMSKKKEHRK